MAGLTATGFTKKTLDEIKTELEDAFRAVFGPFINLLPTSMFSIIIGIFAERISEVWDLAEAVYHAQYPDTATGVSLDNVLEFNGIERLGATFSTVIGHLLFGDVGTIVPDTTLFSVEGNPQAIFKMNNQVELVAGVNAEQLIEFSAVPDGGSFTVTFKGETSDPLTFGVVAQDVEDAINQLGDTTGAVVTGDFTTGFAVEFDGDDGLQPQDLIEVDTTLLTISGNPITGTVTETTPGEAQGSVNLTALTTGPTAAPAGILTVIDTPVTGLTRVYNPDSANTGRDEETDPAARTRRESSLAIGGSATMEAIRAKLLNLDDVDEVIMFENDTGAVDGDGRPSHSFEAVVDGGDDDEIANVIWLAKPAGIKAYGNTLVNITDSQGDTREIGFSRATLVPIFFSCDLTVDDSFPINGAILARDAVLEYGRSLLIGADVIVYPKLMSALADIPGILDVVIRIDDAAVSTTPGAPEVSANITIAATDRAEFSEANTNVNVLP